VPALELQSGNHVSSQSAPASGEVAANYTYDSQGTLTLMSYAAANGASTVFSYTLDAMERPTGMTSGPVTWASGVTYNAANQMTYDGTQTRTYNNLMQTTQVGNMTYNYSSNKNNGQIVSSVDAVTAETITYQYDALKRLLAASGKNWGETYAYDGFGNLLQMSPTGTAGAPSLSVTVGSTTNRLATQGVVYDSNGNLTSGLGGLSLVYDTDNRLAEVENSVGDYYYAYDSDNRRIYYRNASNNETIYFYGADGRKITSYTMTFLAYGAGIQMNPAAGGGNVYFAGILLAEEGNSVTTDRLGSVRWGGPSNLGYQAQYPYGVEYTTTANQKEPPPLALGACCTAPRPPGGQAEDGDVYRLVPPSTQGGAWTEQILYTFPGYAGDGEEPAGPLAFGRDGTIYGTTEYGGASFYDGTFFQLAPPAASGGAWTEAALLSLGGLPNGVVLAPSGVLYGTTMGTQDIRNCENGDPCGAVFQLAPPGAPGEPWTQTILHTFTGALTGDGSQPNSTPVLGPGGVLYGTTATGGTGSPGLGTIYEMMPPSSPGGGWTEVVLYSFTGGADGSTPNALTLGPDGNLYGTTLSGGASDDGTRNQGTVFQLVLP
jgi:hypothetical protein